MPIKCVILVISSNTWISWVNAQLLCFMHQSFVAPAPLGPRISGAFNFSIFKALLKALHCRANFVENPR